MTTEGRVRWSCGSVLVQTGQWHPIMGMPALVPVPRKRSSMSDILIGYRLESELNRTQRHGGTEKKRGLMYFSVPPCLCVHIRLFCHRPEARATGTLAGERFDGHDARSKFGERLWKWDISFRSAPGTSTK